MDISTVDTNTIKYGTGNILMSCADVSIANQADNSWPHHNALILLTDTLVSPDNASYYSYTVASPGAGISDLGGDKLDNITVVSNINGNFGKRNIKNLRPFSRWVHYGNISRTKRIFIK